VGWCTPREWGGVSQGSGSFILPVPFLSMSPLEQERVGFSVALYLYFIEYLRTFQYCKIFEDCSQYSIFMSVLECKAFGVRHSKCMQSANSSKYEKDFSDYKHLESILILW
jgi:hypothetical protein